MIRKTYVVAEHQRGLLIKDGRLIRVLEPGRYVFWDASNRLSVEMCDARGLFASTWAEIIEKRHPRLAARYLEIVRASDGEVVVIALDGRPSVIVRPGQVVHVWKVLKDVTTTRLDVAANPRLTKDELISFERAIATARSETPPMAIVTVGPTEKGLVYFDGELADTLGPGRYGYWTVGRTVKSTTLDMRPQPLEVTAQEILTKDRVSLRVTLSAFVRVVDAVKAASATPDYMGFVYKLVQFAVREAVGGRTLDEVLNDRETVDAQVAAYVRGALGDIGVEVEAIGVKDVILPGEMRALINKVVEAEKAAQANVIRRREETAATRSLLNTARLMDDNPTLLRLKELEALERVTEKIGRIDVHASSGEGLNAVLDRLVHIKSATRGAEENGAH